MSEILKMVRFDIGNVSTLTLPYVAGFIVLSAVLAVFGIPLCMLCLIAPLCLFAPADLMSKPTLKRIYGVLPVSRTAALTASFAEMGVSLFIGEVLSLLMYLVCSVTTLYRLLPEYIRDISRSLVDPQYNNAGFSAADYSVLMVEVFALLCLLTAYLKMMTEIHGADTSVRYMISALSALAAAAAAVIILSKRGIITSVKSLLIPDSSGGKWLLCIAVNIISAAVFLLSHRYTLAKTSDYEL
ncbi:MAG: hypothetical protein IJ874_02625 [Ruminococcus sp.]|nr:hypothetical protein [Ruminococcus sp.]